MTPDQTVRKLLTAKPERTIEHVADELTRQAARVAWVRETSAALREAQREADQEWERSLISSPGFPGEGDHAQHGGGVPLSQDFSEDEQLPEPPEEAKVDALFAQLRAVADHDRWPRHLYFSGI